MAVEQAAGDVGEIDLAGVFVFEFVQAAFATSVAERLPFRRRQGGKRQGPELGTHGGIGTFHGAGL